MKLINVSIPLTAFLRIRDNDTPYIVIQKMEQNEIQQDDLLQFENNGNKVLVKVLEVIDNAVWLVDGNLFISFKVLR